MVFIKLAEAFNIGVMIINGGKSSLDHKVKQTYCWIQPVTAFSSFSSFDGGTQGWTAEGRLLKRRVTSKEGHNKISQLSESSVVTFHQEMTNESLRWFTRLANPQIHDPSLMLKQYRKLWITICGRFQLITRRVSFVSNSVIFENANIKPSNLFLHNHLSSQQLLNQNFTFVNVNLHAKSISLLAFFICFLF